MVAASYPAKPAFPRLYRRTGAPSFWLPMEGPRHVFRGDTGDVADVIGNVPAGARSGPCNWVSGESGPCLSFSSSGVTLAASASLDAGATSFSVGVRFRTSTNQNDAILLEHGVWGTTNGWVYQLTLQTGAVRFNNPTWYYNGGQAESPANYYDGAWHDLVGVYDLPSQMATVYFDGVVVATKGGRAALTGGAYPTYLGARSASLYPFTGQLDGAWFARRALAPSEVGRLRADPYWRLRPWKRWRKAYALGLPPHVAPVGISATDGFGMPLVARKVSISATGIAPADIFGGPSLSIKTKISATGISASDTFGTPSLVGKAAPPTMILGNVVAAQGEPDPFRATVTDA